MPSYKLLNKFIWVLFAFYGDNLCNVRSNSMDHIAMGSFGFILFL